MSSKTSVGGNAGQRPPVSEETVRRVDQVLSYLLQPSAQAELEQFRFLGSTNRVYRIPLGHEDDFVIVKLLPSRWIELKLRVKGMVRNFLYREHDISMGKERVQAEIDRYKEWYETGLRIPGLIPTRFEGVRAFEGLDFPTLYLILNDAGIPLARKLEIVGVVTQSLAAQHNGALATGNKGLVHRDPGPWNVMYDMDADVPYWYDLEHLADTPGMTTEALCARATRVFLHGVLTYIGDDNMEAGVRVFVRNYGIEPVLDHYVFSLHRRKQSLFYQTVERLRTNGSSRLLRSGLLETLQRVISEQRSERSRYNDEPQRYA